MVTERESTCGISCTYSVKQPWQYNTYLEVFGTAQLDYVFRPVASIFSKFRCCYVEM
jgi:hypothetical protein